MNNELRSTEVRRQVVVITGASTGLGLEIARAPMHDRFHLVLTARASSVERFQREGIEESDTLWIRPLDVLNPLEREALIRELDERVGGVDVLINNAGFAYRSVLEHVLEPEALLQLTTNFEGPLELIRLVLPSMRRRRSGRIINVSSVGGMMAMPTLGMYSASKFALEGASEALYYEVKPWNISVTLIEPGFINSESFQNTRFTRLSKGAQVNPDEPYYGHYQFMGSFIERMMRLSPATASGVARTVRRVVHRRSPPLRVPATPDAYVFDLLRRWMPRSLYHWILYHGLPHAPCWGDPGDVCPKCRVERERARARIRFAGS